MKKILAAFLLFSFPAFSTEYTPYFNGTILEFNSSNQLAGQSSLQLITAAGCFYGNYDNNWSMQPGNHYTLLTPQLWGYIGLTNYLQINFGFNSQTMLYKGKSSTHFGDTLFGFGTQFLWDKKGTVVPNLRLDINEIFPTGAYKNLDPYFNTNNASGFGSYQTSVDLVVQKTFYNIPDHIYNINFSINYSYYHPTSISGINRYGGAINTSGRMNPSDTLLFDLSVEYLFFHRQNFEVSLALDLQYLHAFRGSFKGFTGTIGNHPAPIDTESGDLVTALPALEICLSPNLAFYVGGYFTLIGRNYFTFALGVFSVNGSF